MLVWTCALQKAGAEGPRRGIAAEDAATAMWPTRPPHPSSPYSSSHPALWPQLTKADALVRPLVRKGEGSRFRTLR